VVGIEEEFRVAVEFGESEKKKLVSTEEEGNLDFAG
jgi:hypothetical protein